MTRSTQMCPSSSGSELETLMETPEAWNQLKWLNSKSRSVPPSSILFCFFWPYMCQSLSPLLDDKVFDAQVRVLTLAEDCCFPLKFLQNVIEMFCKSMSYLEKPDNEVSWTWWALIYCSEQLRKQRSSSCLLSISTEMDENTDIEDRKQI